MEKEKTKLTVVFDEKDYPKEFLNYLELRFDITVEELGNKADLLIFTGGSDLDPGSYGDNPLPTTISDPVRDKRNTNTYFEYRNTPKVGFGRGAQFLNMMMGGFIIQHIENHNKPHYITIEGFGNLNIESNHHQMMYPFNLSEHKYKILAWTKNFRSDTYLSGSGNEIDLSPGFLEVEIIQFENHSLCIQGHPETDSNEEFKEITLLFIENLFKKSKVEKSPWENDEKVESSDRRDEIQPITEALPSWMKTRESKSSYEQRVLLERKLREDRIKSTIAASRSGRVAEGKKSQSGWVDLKSSLDHPQRLTKMKNPFSEGLSMSLENSTTELKNEKNESRE